MALDRHGNLAAATSTGGYTGKLPGRIGDSPLAAAARAALASVKKLGGDGGLIAVDRRGRITIAIF